ncbi:hypothetical protein [Schinkia azotoformans]|uniref:hypothetical protein n=1 Tax=Schinkia azotoformans TaxID=1454 RepID=UPI002DB59616|nr:hypothetical protein [Schinkia azotoformans]MEC1748076.1 hypothetical protein [Schinkia azotoformans]
MIYTNVIRLSGNLTTLEIKSILNSSDNVIHLSVTESEVQQKDYRKINKVLKVLKAIPKFSCGRLYLTFEGYYWTPLEIYEIKEIRKYVQGLYKREPNLFYFLSPMAGNNFTIMRCLFRNKRISSKGEQTLHNVGVDLKIATKIVESFIKFSQCHDNVSLQSQWVFNNLMPTEFFAPVCEWLGLEKELVTVS